MNDTKMIFGIGISALFTAISLSIIFYFNEKNSSSSTMLGPASDWAWLGIIFGAVYGLLVGGVSGAVITGFQLGIFKAVLFGLIFNFVLGAAFYIIMGGGWNDSLTNDFYASIIVGAINGAVVSLINLGGKPIE